ncbi:ABC transporter ATP-binding protein [Corynebacterium ulcerans]|uniref:Polyamine-transporting ATPase n=2 Tax=Corynebacterium ulcerans TaxID=65058 RepID=A0ABD0BES3_CORUL|nr:ABC transporter ATP-binding protein [Corynebacterium ulcerans]AKN76093.1 ABC transporter protein [Corynebacterium ulcerans FRC58]KPH78280.1 ABC transporter ATP-binding protein [Corynebacterium ulcerans]MBH5295204.1 ATP-binding cassette domain-containing protein [Corynebacterium ulcerans]MBH5301668.1 ATP-binding cassette domain-containing protein [Corynebacterium ulcerans]MBL4944285.1 ATP-binding cassette domain-containing protein [Corynebacterium ulcerans]
MALVHIRNLSVTSRGAQLLNNVSLDADPGELIVILGRSGAGKSTLLRALAGLIPATGVVEVDGESLSGLPPHQRPIAMLMDQPSLFPHMTVEDNIRFAGDSGTHVAMLSLGIDHLALRYPHQLSAGQQQKVALARALIKQPTLMFFDEPLAHVDTYSSEQLKSQILRTHRRLGCTTFYVTHDINEAFSIADRIIFLSRGEIIQDASPQDMREQPACLDIARHLGASIFVPTTGAVTYSPFGTATAAVTALGANLMIDAHPDLHSDDAMVVVGYPTSATAIPTGHQARHLMGATGQVIRNIYMGDHHEVAIETSQGRIVLHCSPDNELAFAAIGNEVLIHCDPEKMWVLPA